MFFAGLAETLEEQIHSGGVGKFGGFAEAAVSQIEELRERADLRIDDAEIEFTARARESFGLGHGFREGFGGFQQIVALVLVRVSDSEQDAAVSGPSALIFRRE